MRIIGIDPGIGRTGYAIIAYDSKQTNLVACGCITTSPKTLGATRLLEIKNDISDIIKKHKPDTMCIESLFFAANAKTAMSVGQARGVVLLTACELGLKIIELTPLQVKMAATGYGKADKAQVQRMVQKLLRLKKIPKPDDAADAAAIAWAGIGRFRLLK